MRTPDRTALAARHAGRVSDGSRACASFALPLLKRATVRAALACAAALALSTSCRANDFEEWLTKHAGTRDKISVFNSANGELSVRELRAGPSSPRPGLAFAWAELRPAGCSLIVEDVREFGPAYEMFEKRVPRDAIAAINGGFFGHDQNGKNIPLGLVIKDGRATNRPMKWSTGGIVLMDDKCNVRITPVRQFRMSDGIVSAVQSKPLLVENGQVAIRGEDERFNRSALALTRSGSIVLAGAFDSFGQAVTLKEFATFLVRLKSIGNLEIETAAAMDGGPGAQLFFPPIARHYGDPGANFIPNLIYVKRSDTRERHGKKTSRLDPTK